VVEKTQKTSFNTKIRGAALNYSPLVSKEPTDVRTTSHSPFVIII